VAQGIVHQVAQQGADMQNWLSIPEAAVLSHLDPQAN
jgi:hypothetical protein